MVRPVILYILNKAYLLCLKDRRYALLSIYSITGRTMALNTCFRWHYVNHAVWASLCSSIARRFTGRTGEQKSESEKPESVGTKSLNVRYRCVTDTAWQEPSVRLYILNQYQRPSHVIFVQQLHTKGT
jgi:hypothetical protein